MAVPKPLFRTILERIRRLRRWTDGKSGAMSKEDETRRGPSGKRPKAGEAYPEAASKDPRTHRALRRAQMRLKAAGLALPTAASAIKLPGGLLAGLTEISAMPKALLSLPRWRPC